MTLYTARIVLSLSAAAAAVFFAGGCADDKSMQPISANDRFEADNATRRVDEVFARQHAAADREDGTLYPQHFTDGRLNSLGYQKLSSMAYGPGGGKLLIYLDVKADAYSPARDSVVKALARGGIAEDTYTITSGANPAMGEPAVTGLNGLAKQSAADVNGPGPIATPPQGNTR